jgi:hypothetical protein
MHTDVQVSREAWMPAATVFTACSLREAQNLIATKNHLDIQSQTTKQPLKQSSKRLFELTFQDGLS